MLLTDLEKFGKDKFVRSLTIQDVREFWANWKDGAISAHKKLERLRAFLSFCVSSKWLGENPAKGVKPPKVTMVPSTIGGEDEQKKSRQGLSFSRFAYNVIIMTSSSGWSGR